MRFHVLSLAVRDYSSFHHIQLIQIILRNVEIAVTPDVTSIAASVGSATDHPRRDVFPIIGPADLCKRVDKTGSDIEVSAQLASLIVPWKYMMIIVISLAECCNRYCNILDR